MEGEALFVSHNLTFLCRKGHLHANCGVTHKSLNK